MRQIILPPEMVELLDNLLDETSTTVITSDKQKYQFMPFWFTKIDGRYRISYLDDLPANLKQAINYTRNTTNEQKTDK